MRIERWYVDDWVNDSCPALGLGLRDYDVFVKAGYVLLRVLAEDSVHKTIEALPSVRPLNGLSRPASKAPKFLKDLAYGTGNEPPDGDQRVDLLNVIGRKFWAAEWRDIRLVR